MTKVIDTERQFYSAIVKQLRQKHFAAEVEEDGQFQYMVRVTFKDGRFLMAENWINGCWEIGVYESEAQLYPSSWEEQERVGEPTMIESSIDEDCTDVLKISKWISGVATATAWRQ